MADWPGNETHGRLGGTICLGMYMTSYRLTLKMRQSRMSNKEAGWRFRNKAAFTSNHSLRYAECSDFKRLFKY